MLDIFRHKNFIKWYDKLRDSVGKKLILARIRQIQINEEFLGDCKSVGDGVTEMRIHYGPGYRVYIAIHDRNVLLLLIGGDKSSQQKDIEKAKANLVEWIRQNTDAEKDKDEQKQPN